MTYERLRKRFKEEEIIQAVAAIEAGASLFRGASAAILGGVIGLSLWKLATCFMAASWIPSFLVLAIFVGSGMRYMGRGDHTVYGMVSVFIFGVMAILALVMGTTCSLDFMVNTSLLNSRLSWLGGTSIALGVIIAYLLGRFRIGESRVYRQIQINRRRARK